MKLFECQNCGQPLYFENTKCESCGLRLGYLPYREDVTALEEADGAWRALATEGELYRAARQARPTMWASGGPRPRSPGFFAPPAAIPAPSPISTIRKISYVGAKSNTPSIACFTRC